MADGAAPWTYADFSADLQGPDAAEERRSNWAVALFFRRPGILCAVAFARAGWAPAMVTLCALALAVTMPLQAWLVPLALAPWTVCASGILFQILDCADGTLARGTGQSSRRGGDMDFLVDMAQWGLLYSSIGLLADRTLGTGFAWTALAILAAWARLLARVIRDRLAKADGPQAETPQPAAPQASLSLIDRVSLFLSGLTGILCLLALSGPWLPWAVGFLLVYALLDVGEGLTPLFRG